MESGRGKHQNVQQSHVNTCSVIIVANSGRASDAAQVTRSRNLVLGRTIIKILNFFLPKSCLIKNGYLATNSRCCTHLAFDYIAGTCCTCEGASM